MVNFCGIHLYPPGREQLRHLWRILTCSSTTAQAEWEDFDGAMVLEGSYRIKVRTTTQAPLPHCMPIMFPSNCDAETLAFARRH